MVRNDYWNFDQDLEGVRSLGAVLDDASFVLSLQGMRLMLDLNQFRGCEGPQPSKVREDHWSFDPDLEGVRSLGAVLDDASFVLPRRGMRLMLDLNQFRGCKGLQPSKVNVVFQGGMASVPSHFSLCYKGLLIYGTGRSPSLPG